VTYRGLYVSGLIWPNEVTFERALKTELNEVRMKSIRHSETGLQTFENLEKGHQLYLKSSKHADFGVV